MHRRLARGGGRDAFRSPRPRLSVLLGSLSPITLALGLGGSFLVGVPSDAAAQEVRSTEVGSETVEEKTGTRRAVIIGISDYTYLEEENDLRYADRDAIAFREFLMSDAGGGLDSANVRLLVNGDAGEIPIKRAISWLVRESQPGDEAIIYFAGHGDVETDYDWGFLLAADVGESNYWLNGGINVRDLAGITGKLGAEGVGVLLITDACRAGTLISQDGAERTTAALARDWEDVIKFVSSEPGQLSFEGEDWGEGHGVFTYFLLAGLYGLADDNPLDGRVTVGELHNYVSWHVSNETGQRQSPMRMGRSSLHLATVDAERLAQIEMEMDTRGVRRAEALLAAAEPGERRLALTGTVDTALVQAVRALEVALAAGALLEPEGRSAWDAYRRLSEIETAEALLPEIESRLAGAFQRDVQGVVRQYLSGGNRQPSAERLRTAARQLEHAIELLGEEDFQAASLAARRSFLEGWALIQAGRHAEALEPLNHSIGLEPEAAYAYNALGFAHLGLDQPAEARKAFEEAAERAPRWSYPAHGLGLVEARSGDEDVAATRFREAIEFDPIYRDPRRELLRIRQRATEKSEQRMLELIAAAPNGTYWRHELAVLYANEGRWEEARDVYREIVRLDPKDVLGLTYLGFIELYLGADPADALRMVRKAARLDPASEAAARVLAAQLENLGRPDEARAVLLAHVERSRSAGAWKDLAEDYLDAGSLDEARQAVDRALEIAPEFAGAVEVLARIHRVRGERAEAERHYLRAIELDSLNATRWQNLGGLYYDEARYEEAERVSRRALALDPGDPILLKNIAVLNDRLGRVERAEEFYREALRVDPLEPDVQLGFGLFLLSHDRYEEAEEYLLHARELDPGDPLSIQNLAWLYNERDEVERAERAYRDWTELEPASYAAHEALGIFYENHDRYPEAIETYRRSLALAVARRDSAAALTNIGDILRYRDEGGDAEESYRAAIAADSTYPWAHNGLGLLLEGMERYAAAVEAYERASALAPFSASIWRNLGDARRGTAEHEAAESAYRRAIDLDSAYVWAHNGLGLALQAQGRDSAAVSAYRMALYHAGAASDTVTIASNLGWLYRERERWPEAEAWFRVAVEADSLAALPHYPVLGFVLEAQGKLDEAEAVYEGAAALEPTEAAHHRSLAFLHSARGDEAATEAAYRRAIEADPLDHQSLNNLAWLLYGRGDLEEAAPLSQRSLEAPGVTASDLAFYLDTRANIFLDAGDPRRALELFERMDRQLYREAGRAYGSSDFTLPLGIAMCHLELGDEEAALESLRLALDLGPQVRDLAFLRDVAEYSQAAIDRVRTLLELGGEP